MVRSRPVDASAARPRVAAALLVLALTGTGCSDADIIDGSGRILGNGSSGVTTPAPATSLPPSSVSASASASAPTPTTPSSGSVPAVTTPAIPPGLVLVRRLRAVSTAQWPEVEDSPTGAAFRLPAAAPAKTRVQNGISQRSYEHTLSKQSTVSVSFVHTASAAAARALLGGYPTQLRNSIRVLGSNDAEVTERRDATVDGQPSVSFRVSFTPTTVPQIPPAWLVTAAADGADIVLAQTIVFPASTAYDYLRLVRVVQQRLVQSLQLSG